MTLIAVTLVARKIRSCHIRYRKRHQEGHQRLIKSTESSLFCSQTATMAVSEVNDTLSISGWYQKQTVFISGGSGFLGKAIVFKLLQIGCSRIYFLIRPKRNQSPDTRLDTVMQHEIFNPLKQNDPDIRSKVIAIAGDISAPNLGISDQDRETLHNNVTVVFHGAASVKFDDSLKEAVHNNLKFTRDMADLASNMKNLKMFNYISTSYSNCDQMSWSEGTEEKVYPRKIDWQKLIYFVDNTPEEIINSVELKILGASPNTYIFTKHLSEALIEDYSKTLPMVITRPPIVNPSWKEPYPGWMDNVSSPVAIIGGCGKGVVRVSIGSPSAKKAYTPVDFSINSIIVATWHEALQYQNNENFSISVYNQDSIPITSTMLRDRCFDILKTHPVSNPLWNTHFILTTNRHIFLILFILLHFLPALLVDAILKIKGQRPRLQRIYRKLYHILIMLIPMQNIEDNFPIDNYKKLQALVPEHEKNIFFLDLPRDGKTFREYLVNCCFGFRKLVGDPPFTTEKDFIMQRRLKIIDMAFQLTVLMLFIWIFPLRLFLLPFLYVYDSVSGFVDSI